MIGGSQSHLMRCADKQFYIVKFKNNMQGSRSLANEMLATRLGLMLGLPMAEGEIINVDAQVILSHCDMRIHLTRGERLCSEGHSFGSRYIGNPNIRYRYIGDDAHHGGKPRVDNLSDFIGMLVFDTWMSNTDSRQAIFHRKCSTEPYHATMIDHGFCLTGEDWLFADTPCRFLDSKFWLYEKVFGIDSFEPWLSRLEQQITLDNILEAAIGIPPEWYEYDWHRLVTVVRTLFVRRQFVRKLIWEIHSLKPLAFPNWPRP